MTLHQLIVTPFGIAVFGSSVVRAMPDVAIIHLSVSEVKPHPKEAFQAIREAAQRIQSFLSTAQVEEAGASHISLKEEYRYQNHETQLVGFRTSVQFQVIVSDLNRLEDILTSIVDAGANTTISINYQSSRMKEIRAEVRTQAILAAREKAEIYCKAAGVELGDVIHIEDVDPDYLQRNEGDTLFEDYKEEIPVFAPISITSAESVLVAFKFRDR